MKLTTECFECGGGGELHFHHILPKSKGGERTVPLCESCHSKVHGKDMATSYLTSFGLLKKDLETNAFIFWHGIVLDKCDGEVMAMLAEEGIKLSFQAVARRLNKMRNYFDADDLIDAFEPILKTSENMFYNKDFIKNKIVYERSI